MIQHCSACRKEVDIWFHAQGLLCDKCSSEYQEVIREWKESNTNTSLDYPPFHVWGNFVSKKQKELREQGKDTA